MSKSTKPSLGALPTKLVGGIVFVAVLAGGAYAVQQAGGVTELRQNAGIFFNDQERLQYAVDKTINTETAHLVFTSEVNTAVTMAQTGITSTDTNKMDGTFTGSTDGSVSKFEAEIYSPKQPNQKVKVSQIITEDDMLYMMGPATAGKWVEMSVAEVHEGEESGDTDASLYGLILLGSMFDGEAGLLSAIDTGTVVAKGEVTIDGSKGRAYHVEIAIPEFLEAMKRAEGVTEVQLADSERILESAVISADLFVDDVSGYVTQIDITAKNLQQLLTDDVKQVVSKVTHDTKLIAKLSRFNVATNIKKPNEDEIIREEKVLGVSIIDGAGEYLQQ